MYRSCSQKVTHEWIHANAEVDPSTSFVLAWTDCVGSGFVGFEFGQSGCDSPCPQNFGSRPSVVSHVVRIFVGRTDSLGVGRSSSLDASD
jgi:hypothetical protein